MPLRPMHEIRADLEKLDEELTNYKEQGLLPELIARRNILAAEVQAWLEVLEAEDK